MIKPQERELKITFGTIRRWGTAESLQAPAENGRNGADQVENDEDSILGRPPTSLPPRPHEETAAGAVEQNDIIF